MCNKMMIKEGLNLICGRSATGKTTYLVDVANQLCDKKILFLSLEISEALLRDRYQLQVSENIIIIDRPTNIEEISKYISEYTPDYLLIDYLILLQTEDKKKDWDIKYRLNLLSEYASKYNINVVATHCISSKTKEEKDKSSIYENWNKIILK